MKRVDAVIRPSQLESVKQRVTALGVTGLTVSEVADSAGRRGTRKPTAAPNTTWSSCRKFI